MRTSRAIGDAIRTARTPLTPITQRRHLQDVAITRTGKPIIRVQGGRSSLGGHTATVFGATGFLGRYIVNRLARQGCSVVVPYREEMAKRHLKVTGDLGRVVFMVRLSLQSYKFILTVLPRNMILEILSPLKRACATPMW